PAPPAVLQSPACPPAHPPISAFEAARAVPPVPPAVFRGTLPPQQPSVLHSPPPPPAVTKPPPPPPLAPLFLAVSPAPLPPWLAPQLQLPPAPGVVSVAPASTVPSIVASPKTARTTGREPVTRRVAPF